MEKINVNSNIATEKDNYNRIFVTTCNKRKTLGPTINSIIGAGWSLNDIFIYIDGLYMIPEYFGGCSYGSQAPQVGAWPHWFRSLENAYLRWDQEWYPMIQDDVVFCRGVRAYLERNPVPDDASIYSIFTPAHYTGDQRGWYEVSDPSLWMAQTFFIRREAVRDILFSKIVWGIRGNKQIDNRIGLWLDASKRKIYYHTPSLAQHIGEESTIWTSGVGVEGKRKARSFDEALDLSNFNLYT